MVMWGRVDWVGDSGVKETGIDGLRSGEWGSEIYGKWGLWLGTMGFNERDHEAMV